MPRRLLALLCILGIAACQSDRTTAGPDLPPSFVVQDGANNSGNADFFFHPPLAPDPIGHPKFSVGQFNPALAPMVEVCRLNTSLPQNPTTASTCAGPVIPVAPVVLVAVNELYLAEWMAPAVNDAQFHRFFVRAGGKLLGSADVLLSHPKNLKGYKGPVPTAVPSQTVPVKFRIENRALCAEVEGTSPCASAAVDLSTGGNVTIPTVQGKPHSGVNVPGGNGSGKINVTVEPCAGGTLYHRGLVDIPMYGSYMLKNY